MFRGLSGTAGKACGEAMRWAIGEIGLDYYWEENASPDVQKRFLKTSFCWPKGCACPLLSMTGGPWGHHGAAAKHKPKGVLHCFSGSVETARQAVKLGLYLGFEALVTFKNARHPVEAAGAVPLTAFC